MPAILETLPGGHNETQSNETRKSTADTMTFKI